MIHLEKRGIRALGIAESFRKGYKGSIIAGVVMRNDLVIDGIMLAKATVRGDDATDAILNLYNSFNRNDINILIIDGLIISMYNIIDIDHLYEAIRKPIIAVTFNESKGLDEYIIRSFPDDYHKKLSNYHKLGLRESILLKTGYKVYIRSRGLDKNDTIKALNKFLLQGSVPEPIRIAKLIARAYLRFISS